MAKRSWIAVSCAVVMVAGLAAVAGCGDDDDGGGDADASVTGIKATGIVTDGASGPPLAGMEVCIIDFPAVPCATSDATGRFVVSGIPKDVKFNMSFTKQGYYPRIFFFAAKTADFQLSVFVQTTAMIQAQAAAAGQTLDPQKGIVAFQVPGALAGTKFSLSPMSGSGPYYLNAQGTVDLTLMATPPNSQIALGAFVNVAPGNYVGTVMPPSGVVCSYAVPDALPNTSQIKVFAGYLTQNAATCQ